MFFFFIFVRSDRQKGFETVLHMIRLLSDWFLALNWQQPLNSVWYYREVLHKPSFSFGVMISTNSEREGGKRTYNLWMMTGGQEVWFLTLGSPTNTHTQVSGPWCVFLWRDTKAQKPLMLTHCSRCGQTAYEIWVVPCVAERNTDVIVLSSFPTCF